jgi:hypothetical protein
MHLDQDRQNVTGSPPLADTIKRKIRGSRVFIGDVTPVSKIPKRKGVKDSREKRNMNPNAAIELGYSLAIAIDSPYEIRDDVFSETFVLTEASRAAIDSALLRIYQAFFGRAGYPRPSSLFGFPLPA